VVLRYSGSCVLYSLMSSNPDEFDSAVARHVPPKDQRNTEDKICQLKQKVCYLFIIIIIIITITCYISSRSVYVTLFKILGPVKEKAADNNAYQP